MQNLNDLMVAHAITITSVFVPQSQSRNAGKNPTLNWRCTLKIGEREIMTFDYSQGMGYAPSAKMKTPTNYDRGLKKLAQKHEAETGRTAKFFSHSYTPTSGSPIPPPRPDDVFHCVLMDSYVLDSGGFESWAANCGYEPNSRKAEAIYRECLEQSLKLSAGIGRTLLERVREFAMEM